MSEESVPQAHVRTPETDEVLRRIGRNVVIFLQVEYLLKHLTSHAAVHAPASQLATRMDEQRAAVHKKTMGELAGKLVSELFDVADEQTRGGGTRTIYRINERYALQIPQDLAVTEQQALVARQGGLERCQSD